MRRRLGFVCGVALVLLGSLYVVTHSLVAQRRAPVKPNQNTDICCKLTTNNSIQLKTEVIASGLEHPWGLAFLPDGALLVTERRGRLYVLRDGRKVALVGGLPKIAAVGQGGLLDVVLDPNFAQNNLIYLSFAQADNKNPNTYGTAVLLAKLENSGNTYTLKEQKIIFSDPNKTAGGRHFGARLVFAKDQTLFVTLGERGNPKRAQDSFDYAGSVLRINTDGKAPLGNPFVLSAGDTSGEKKGLAEIYSIGHRNAQGAALHPVTGKLWTLAHGAKGGDEINIIEAGKNYGWAVISYGTQYNNAPIGVGVAATGYEQPVYYWDPSIAPSGLTFYVRPSPTTPLAIPQWEGSLIAGALRGQLISRLVLQGDRVVREEQYLQGALGRIRDVRTGIDGALWLLTDEKNGKIVRVSLR